MSRGFVMMFAMIRVVYDTQSSCRRPIGGQILVAR
jgi:hypothetical protein